jgi:regulator of PEP synthase PpsR (kinase-PPPase family)
MLSEERETDYAADEAVQIEVRDARRLFARNRWPVIDVTNRPIEQTANRIMKLLAERIARAE